VGEFEREAFGEEREGLIQVLDCDPEVGDPLDLHDEPFSQTGRRDQSDELDDKSELVEEPEVVGVSVLADEVEGSLDLQQEPPPRP